MLKERVMVDELTERRRKKEIKFVCAAVGFVEDGGAKDDSHNCGSDRPITAQHQV
jgi:hypothetical protein